ncbi:hypothetical protein IJZ97_02910 [bacterium]|nr:hypothetical protein [bacterium]
MRVNNNLFVLYPQNNYKERIQQKPYLSIAQTSFEGSFKRRHIDNVMHAIFNSETQDTMQNIYRNLKGIKKFFADMNPQKVAKIKQDYGAMEAHKGVKGYVFKLSENSDNLDTISVARSNKNANLIRIAIKDKEEKTTHFLIDGLDKSVSNINQNLPSIIPAKLRYMTSKEVENSGVKKYINLADQELDKFKQYLENYNNPSTSLKIIKEESTVQSIVAKSQEFKPKTLLAIFDGGAENLPKHVTPQISPASNKVVAFSLQTEDGGTLKVAKKMNPSYGDQLRYVSLEKVMPDGDKKFMAIDLASKNFLKVDPMNGKPIVVKDTIYQYTSEDLAKNELINDFNNYITEIFRKPKTGEESLSQNVTVLKIKQNKPKIEDISIEDLEDKKLNKILDKEFLKGEKATSVETTKVSKKRGRKPKVKDIETPKNEKLNIQDYISNTLGKTQQDVISKATKDADDLADLYFKTFVARFKESFGQKMADFKSKYDELFKM